MLILRQNMYHSYEMNSADFEELSESTLLTILQMKKMDMSELDLFHAIVSWAGRKCSEKNVQLNGSNKRKVIRCFSV